MKKLLILSMIISMSTLFFSQERTVYGRVLDDNNNPVSGVMIELLNTSQNTFTDNMGRFHLNFPKGNRKLYFTHSDFHPQKVFVKGSDWKKPFYISLASISGLPKIQCQNRAEK